MTLSVKCFHNLSFLLALFVLSNVGAILKIAPTTYAQTTKENLTLRDQLSKLQDDLADQKELTSNLLEKLNDIIKNQNQLIINFGETTKLIHNISTVSLTTSQTFKDAFILNKSGRPVAFIDDGLKLYEYSGGNLIGWIKPETNEIVRNFDNSIVAQIENDFILDETGHAIGSVERSENLKWDREKLYAQVQKNPVSQYFVRLENPKQFNLSTFRYSDWSVQKLEDILFFSDKKIQKLK